MPQRPHPIIFLLQQAVVDLANITRNHDLLKPGRRENDVEHSFMVALLAWYVCSANNLPLDMAKVLKYGMAHDFVELYAGDTNTYATPAERVKKVERERESLAKISVEFKEFGDLVDILRQYEAKSDEESLFVWTVDKMQALILGDMDNWRPFENLDISYEQFVKKHSGQIVDGSPYCREIFEKLLEYCKPTFYARPQSVRRLAE